MGRGKGLTSAERASCPVSAGRPALKQTSHRWPNALTTSLAVYKWRDLRFGGGTWALAGPGNYRELSWEKEWSGRGGGGGRVDGRRTGVGPGRISGGGGGGSFNRGRISCWSLTGLKVNPDWHPPPFRRRRQRAARDRYDRRADMGSTYLDGWQKDTIPPDVRPCPTPAPGP